MRLVAAAMTVGILFAPEARAGDEEWALARSEDGVEVYTRDVGGSALKEFRATAVVPAPLAQVVAWWRDPTTYTRWIYRCVEARRVEGAAGAWGNYLKFDFPFPASDRDVVLRARLLEESAGSVVYEGGNVDGLVPPVTDLVRIPSVRSRWEFRAQGEGATAVVYRQHMDAGGSLPAFILNQAAVDSPFGTLRGLARYAAEVAAGP
jgi:hypothetical protein